MLLVSFSSTVPPVGHVALASASTSAPVSSATPATMRTNSWYCSFLAPHSVSLLHWPTAHLPPSTATPTRPSTAARPALLGAAVRPAVRHPADQAHLCPPLPLP